MRRSRAKLHRELRCSRCESAAPALAPLVPLVPLVPLDVGVFGSASFPRGTKVPDLGGASLVSMMLMLIVDDHMVKNGLGFKV